MVEPAVRPSEQDQELRDAGIPLARIHTVVVTHSHPDHDRGVGRLAKEAEAALVTDAGVQTSWESETDAHLEHLVARGDATRRGTDRTLEHLVDA